MGWLVEYAVTRMKNKQNFLMAMFGQTGTGKSYSAISLASKIDDNFTSDNIVFSPEEFMQLLTKRDEKGDKFLKPGSMIVFDEAGVGIDARTWFKKQNRIIKNVMQTFRHYRIGVIFTTPHMGFIDKSVRRLMHCIGEMIDPNYMTAHGAVGWGWAKVFQVQINPLGDKFLYRYPLIRDGNRWVRLAGKSPSHGNFRFSLASEDVLRGYEVAKMNYTENLNRESSGEMLGIDNELNLVKIIRFLIDRETYFNLGRREGTEKDLVSEVMTRIAFDYPGAKMKKFVIEQAINMYFLDKRQCFEMVDDSLQSLTLNKRDLPTLQAAFAKRKDWLLVAYDLNISDKKLMAKLEKWVNLGYMKWNDANLDKYRIFEDRHTGADLSGAYRSNRREDDDDIPVF